MGSGAGVFATPGKVMGVGALLPGKDTIAFSKKLASHRHALALYFTFYNWTRIHKTLRVTPAMAAGLTDHLWTMEEIIGLMDEVAPKPGRPKTYKKRIAA